MPAKKTRPPAPRPVVVWLPPDGPPMSEEQFLDAVVGVFLAVADCGLVPARPRVRRPALAVAPAAA